MHILSLKLIKCGEVKEPTLYPFAMYIAANDATVDPLPFVPATVITGICQSKTSKYFATNLGLTSLNFTSVRCLFSKKYSQSDKVQDREDWICIILTRY